MLFYSLEGDQQLGAYKIIKIVNLIEIIFLIAKRYSKAIYVIALILIRQSDYSYYMSASQVIFMGNFFDLKKLFMEAICGFVYQCYEH